MIELLYLLGTFGFIGGAGGVGYIVDKKFGAGRRRALPITDTFGQLDEDLQIKELEQMYVDGKIDMEELDRRAELILSPEARAIEQKKLDYQSDWVRAIHQNNMLDAIKEQKRLDEEYFFEHGKPRPKPIKVDSPPVYGNSAYGTVFMSQGYGSSSSFPLAQYVDTTKGQTLDVRPKWAKDAEAMKKRQELEAIHAAQRASQYFDDAIMGQSPFETPTMQEDGGVGKVVQNVKGLNYPTPIMQSEAVRAIEKQVRDSGAGATLT